MIVTIHQPDFMPWFGFFRKIAHADLWVLLDHVVNNPRDAAFWGRRVRILVNGSPIWLSIPLRRPATLSVVGVPINEMQVNLDDPAVFERAWQTVRMAYAKAPHFSKHSALVEAYFRDTDPSLVARNMRFISAVMSLLDIRTRVVSSATFHTSSKGSALLVDLLRSVGATTYLHGTGASGYQEDALFAAAGIHLQPNTFVHPEYSQLRTKAFTPGLSILDMLFNVSLTQIRSWAHTR
jgi:hypothetical protein